MQLSQLKMSFECPPKYVQRDNVQSCLKEFISKQNKSKQNKIEDLWLGQGFSAMTRCQNQLGSSGEIPVPGFEPGGV